MLKIALLACLVAIAVAHTHPPHPTHPTHPAHLAVHGGNEHGGLKFVYDDKAGTMVMMTHTHCYLMMLTDAEKMDVHDRLKMEALEITMAALAADQTKQTTVTDTTGLDQPIVDHCKHLALVKLTH